MALDSGQIETITFDSFSTLVDVDSTAPAVAPYVDDPIPFAREWHSRAATYGMIANYIDAYETYFQLHRDALEYLLAVEDVTVSEAELDEMTAIYHEMRPFDDVEPGLTQLAEAGYTLGVISNGDPAMLESLLAVTEVKDQLSAVVSADEIERHKPAVELYEHAADRLETPIDRITHVSNGIVDVYGAMHAGMQGIWLNRQDAPAEPFGPSPDLCIDSIEELVAHVEPSE
ncbi:MAG: haloacid dehalogenase type II [Halobacteriales archaeon]|nr:haloacid dehalogenase type II [Halobacteriales archaeon]